jgi:hypothetical protein
VALRQNERKTVRENSACWRGVPSAVRTEHDPRLVGLHLEVQLRDVVQQPVVPDETAEGVPDAGAGVERVAQHVEGRLRRQSLCGM